VRRTVVLGAVLTTAVPLSIVSWRHYVELGDAYTQQAATTVANSALNTSARLDALISARLDAVRLAAQNPALVDALMRGTETSEARIAMQALVRLDATHNTLAGLVDNERRLVMSTAPAGADGGPDARDLAYPIVVATPDSTGSISQMVFLASVRDARGRQIGVLGLRTRTTALSQVLSTSSNDPNTLSRIRQTSGEVMAAWPRSRPGGLRPSAQPWDSTPARTVVLQQGIREDGVRERRYQHSAGGTILREAASRLASVPWYVSVSRDEAVVLGPARLALQRSLLITAIVALLVGWLAMYVATRFAARIEALASVVRRIAEGDRTARPVPARTANDEIDQLGSDVERMAGELEQLVSRLEERSAQLEAELRERSTLEERLLEARRLEAVGLVSGMVAHDFNNVLTIVRSAADTTSLALPHDHDAQADIAEIVQAVERGADLTRRMLAIARRNADAPRRFDANEMIRDSARLLRRLLPGGDLTVATSTSSAWVYVDTTSLLQCLMNLVNNARDASGTDSPRVHITVTRVVELPPFFLGGEAPAPGDYVAVAVRDYGVGISPEALARLAEPFYTTKSSARGTGLGLASISHTCREAGGALTAISTMGEGSVFTILLPFAGTLPNHAIPVGSNAPISETAGAERLTGPITG